MSCMHLDLVRGHHISNDSDNFIDSEASAAVHLAECSNTVVMV